MYVYTIYIYVYMFFFYTVQRDSLFPSRNDLAVRRVADRSENIEVTLSALVRSAPCKR